MSQELPRQVNGRTRAAGPERRSGVVTLLFTDVGGSTALKERLGDHAGVDLIQEHHSLLRLTLEQFAGAEEILVAGDSFLVAFPIPSVAVRCALVLQSKLREFNRNRPLPVEDRIGLHMGEVLLEDMAGKRDVHGMQVDTCARVMSLAQPGQILMTRAVFDNARQSLKGEEVEGISDLDWLNHGRFELKGVAEPVEICEVRVAAAARLAAPATSEKARRVETAEGEAVLGWRPAIGLLVPNTPWALEEKLGEGGFGEVWVASHGKLKERRVFKFCFRADRVRALKREMTIFRLLKEHIGEHPNIVRLHEVYLDTPPFYLQEDYVDGKDLRSWCEAQGGIAQVPMHVRLEIAAQAAEGLQAAHDAGVIHRDVKPGNILVSSLTPLKSQPVARLTDFGIGQVISEEVLQDVTRAGFTQTVVSHGSSQTGTQMYMAPELWAGKPASTRSDIYSLGVVLFQLLVGDFQRPVTTDWAKDVRDPLLRDDLEHCFTWKPEERFGGAVQLARQLRNLPERRALLERQGAALERAARSAARRAALRIGTLASFIIVSFALLALWAVRQSRVAVNKAREARMHLYDADMTLAFQALERGHIGRLRELLNKYAPGSPSNALRASGQADLRGWEWRYLWQRARGDDLMTLRGHSNVVYSAEMLRDGRTIVSVGVDHAIRFWDAKTGALLETLNFPDEAVCAAVSPDRSLLLVGGTYGTWNLWDTGRRELRLAWTNATSTFGAGAAFSTDSKWMAAIHQAGVEIWDVANLKRVKLVDRGPPARLGFVLGVAFSRDGTRIAYPHADRRIVLHHLATGLEETVGKLAVGTAYCLAFSPDDRSIVSGGLEGLSVWDVASRSLQKHLTNHLEQVISVALSSDGQLAASASGDQTIRLWDARSWQELRVFRGHEHEVYSVRFSPDEKNLISSSKDETVRIWPAELRQTLPDTYTWPEGSFPVPLHPSAARQLQILSTNDLLTSFGLFDLLHFQPGPAKVLPSELASADIKPNYISRVSQRAERPAVVSADLTRIAAARTDGAVEIWSTSPLANIKVLSESNLRVNALALSGNGTWLAVGRSNGDAELFDVANNRLLDRLPPVEPGRVWWQFVGDCKYEHLAFWAEDRLLVRTTPDSKTTPCLVEVFRLSERDRRVIRPTHRYSITNYEISRDGKLLATCAWDGLVKLWDLSTGKEIHTFRGQLVGYVSLGFSPDGSRLAAGGWDGTITLWDLATRQQVGQWPTHGRNVCVVNFLEPGGLLLSFARDRLVTGVPPLYEAWRAPSLAEIDESEKASASNASAPR